jgi:ssDNA-binding Zn-finger/Zn-ribbon topoisomerase 1
MDEQALLGAGAGQRKEQEVNVDAGLSVEEAKKLLKAQEEEAKKKNRKKCPSCGKECVPRKGRNGEFYGCPDFPKCPGKAASMSAAQRQASSKKLRYCYDFINRIGGVKEADKWLKIATEIILTVKENK